MYSTVAYWLQYLVEKGKVPVHWEQDGLGFRRGERDRKGGRRKERERIAKFTGRKRFRVLDEAPQEAKTRYLWNCFLNFCLCPNTLALSSLYSLSLESACHRLPPESLSNLTAVLRAEFPPFLRRPFILISFHNRSLHQTPLLPWARFYCSQQFISPLQAASHSSLSPVTCRLLNTLKVPPRHARQHSHTKPAENKVILY